MRDANDQERSVRNTAMTESQPAATVVTGVILAGGLGRRMGGADKGLQLFNSKPLVSWVWERLSPQVSEVLINANRNIARYSSFGSRVITDIDGQQAGPLAGLQRGLMEASGELVVTVPCDSPCFPMDLVERLCMPLRDKNVDLATVRTVNGIQPVFCMARTSLLPQLTAFIEDGGRKVDAWFATLRIAAVDFGNEADFTNINTLDELKAAESRLRP